MAVTSNFTYSQSSNEVTFTDYSSTGSGNTIVSWLWDFGDYTSSTERNPTHFYPNRGNFTVSLTVTDSTSATNTSSQAVYALAALIPDFTFTVSGAVVNFTNTSTDPNNAGAEASASSWDFGDGTGSNPYDFNGYHNIQHTYSTPGTYSVTMSVSNSYGIYSSVTKAVTTTAVPPGDGTGRYNTYDIIRTDIEVSDVGWGYGSGARVRIGTRFFPYEMRNPSNSLDSYMYAIYDVSGLPDGYSLKYGYYGNVTNGVNGNWEGDRYNTEANPTTGYVTSDFELFVATSGATGPARDFTVTFSVDAKYYYTYYGGLTARVLGPPKSITFHVVDPAPIIPSYTAGLTITQDIADPSIFTFSATNIQGEYTGSLLGGIVDLYFGGSRVISRYFDSSLSTTVKLDVNKYPNLLVYMYIVDSDKRNNQIEPTYIYMPEPPQPNVSIVSNDETTKTIHLTGINNNTQSPIASATWDFGDGTAIVSNSYDVTHTYSAIGYYNIRFTLTDIYGRMSLCDQYIQYYSPFIIDILVQKSGSYVVLSAGIVYNQYYSPNQYIYEWRYDGNIIGTTSEINYDFGGPGTYTVQLDGWMSQGEGGLQNHSAVTKVITISSGSGVNVKDFTWLINPLPTITSPSILPDATVTQIYSYTLATLDPAGGGTTLISSNLPSGLSIVNPTSSTPQLSGILVNATPSAYNFDLSITSNTTGCSTSKPFSLNSVAVPSTGLTINQTAFSPVCEGVTGSPFITMTASGGVSPYYWSISSGELPVGTALAPLTGAVAGTAYVAGSYTFEIKVTDSTGA